VKKIFKYKGSRAHVECKNASDNSNSRENWNPLKIIQKNSVKRNGKALYQEIQKKVILGTAHVVQKVLNV